MQVLYFVNKAAGKRYKVLAIDRSHNPPILTLQGQYAKFHEQFDKERFKSLGYDLVAEDEPDPKEAK